MKCFKEFLIGAALGAWAMTLCGEVMSGKTGTNFAAHPKGDFVAGMADDGTEPTAKNPTYWHTEATDYEATVSYPDYQLGRLTLSIGTDTPLYRTIQGVSDPLKAVDVDVWGIYFDTTVRFSAFGVDNEGEEPTFPEDVKCMVWLRELTSGATPQTNLAVTAGYLTAGGPVRKTYVLETPAGVDWETPHRVTVRTLKNIADRTWEGPEAVGFVVYLDGAAVGYPADESAGDPDTVLDCLNATAAACYTDTLHTLVPSFQQAETEHFQRFREIGYAGAGEIDGVWCSDVDAAPDFADEGIRLILKWDRCVTGFRVENPVSGETLCEKTGLTVPGEVNLHLPRPGKTQPAAEINYSIALSDVTYAEEYEKGEWAADDAVPGLVGFSSIRPNAECRLVSSKIAKILYEVAGQTFTGLNEALQACVTAFPQPERTLKLLDNAVIDLTESRGGSLFLGDGQCLVLDLAGKTLKGSGDEPTLMVYGGSLIVTNSSETVGCVKGDDVFNTSLMYGEVRDLEVFGGRFDEVVEEVLGAPFQIHGGEFRLVNPYADLEEKLDGDLAFEAIDETYARVVRRPAAARQRTLALPLRSLGLGAGGADLALPANAMTSVSPDGRTLTVNGVAYARPNYVFRRVGSQYVMEIDPSVAVVRAIQTADGVVEIVPTSSVKGFWYQVEYSSTLNFADAKRTEPVEGTGEALSLTAPKGDGSLFYRLIVSDIDPHR